MGPILCAGVTSYKGIKETEAKPGEWIAVSGIGGLGQLAVQYAKAMGLHVAALDVTEEKLALARESGADVMVNAKVPDAAAQVIKETGGGAHARGAGERGIASGVRPGSQVGAAQGHDQPGWPPAR
jgi:propanol-preferring alcohol dehydrogenase